MERLGELLNVSLLFTRREEFPDFQDRSGRVHVCVHVHTHVPS